ncbi:hypothetical protein PMAC_001005 [Pneumocystis sp. 'macacae']|nr:hypothetical protein PMAC_001005 [Pneumocystis sp. 'macacae']
MVCEKCEKKCTFLATPSVKKKSEIYMGSEMSKLVASQERKIGENKLLSTSAKKRSINEKIKDSNLIVNRYDPYGTGCSICKQRTHHLGAKYCPSCAYKQGKCIAASAERKFLIQLLTNRAPDKAFKDTER